MPQTMVEPAAVENPSIAVRSPASTAAMSGIGHLWLNNSGNKQQCRCGTPENPYDGPSGSVTSSLVHRPLLPKTALRVREAAACSFTHYSIARYEYLHIRQVQLLPQ